MSALTGCQVRTPGGLGLFSVHDLPGTGPGRKSTESSARKARKASLVPFSWEVLENARSELTSVSRPPWRSGWAGGAAPASRGAALKRKRKAFVMQAPFAADSSGKSPFPLNRTPKQCRPQRNEEKEESEEHEIE